MCIYTPNVHIISLSPPTRTHTHTLSRTAHIQLHRLSSAARRHSPHTVTIRIRIRKTVWRTENSQNFSPAPTSTSAAQLFGAVGALLGPHAVRALLVRLLSLFVISGVRSLSNWKGDFGDQTDRPALNFQHTGIY